MQPMICLQESFPVLWRKLLPLGKYCRKRPPSFSLLPHCQGACGPHSVRAASRCGAAHRPGPPDRSGSCSGHGAASFLFLEPGDQQSGHDSRIWRCPGATCWKWCCGGGPGQAASVRQLVPWLQMLRCRCLQPGSDGRRTWRARFGCLMPGAANSTRIPPCPFKLFAF